MLTSYKALTELGGMFCNGQCLFFSVRSQRGLFDYLMTLGGFLFCNRKSVDNSESGWQGIRSSIMEQIPQTANCSDWILWNQKYTVFPVFVWPNILTSLFQFFEFPVVYVWAICKILRKSLLAFRIFGRDSRVPKNRHLGNSILNNKIHMTYKINLFAI